MSEEGERVSSGLELDMASITQTVAHEVSVRAEKLQRVQSLGERVEAVRVKYREVKNEVAALQAAVAAEVGAGAPVAPPV